MRIALQQRRALIGVGLIVVSALGLIFGSFELSGLSTLVFFVTAALVPGVVLCGRRPSDPGAAPGERHLDHAALAQHHHLRLAGVGK